MDKNYLGKKENGNWEPFSASSPEEATPEITGYEEVKEV